MSNLQTERVHFSITGEWLTERARDLALSGECDRAEILLLDGLDGISHEEVYSVLSGEKRLVGVNDLMLEDDPDSAGYQQDIEFIYAGTERLMHNGRTAWWKPVAYWKWTSPAVSECNQEVRFRFQAEGEFNEHTQVTVRPGAQRRALLWAKREGAEEGEIVRAISWDDSLSPYINRDEWTFMICERQVIVFYVHCDPPPAWIRKAALRQTPLASFREALKSGRVRPREWDGVETGCPEAVRVSTIGPSIREWTMGKKEEESWPVWDGTGATPAMAPTFVLPSPEETARLLNFELGVDRKAHAIEQIKRQADDSGWMEFPWKDQTLRVPRGAFECWALRRTRFWKEATPWKTISGSGWKQLGDDPYHTDWMLGAGLDDLSMWHWDSTLQDAAYAAMTKVQARFVRGLGLTGTILVALTATVVGEIVHPEEEEVWYKEGGDPKVVVLPNLNPHYLPALTGASLVITENGGALAHLSQVGREQGIPILRLENARKLLPEGEMVRVSGNSIVRVGV